MTGSDSMDAEFDTVAEWTADVALSLGDDHLVPAGCRGSGGPRTLDRLLAEIDVRAGDRVLDVGAGVGGPAAYAARQLGVRPVLLEPEPGACRAARQMFGLPTLRADATRLPIASRSFDVVWSIGVLCTVDDQPAALTELARVTGPAGRVGLLVYEAQHTLPEQPEGNTFPTTDGMAVLLRDAGLVVRTSFEMGDPDDEDDRWKRRLADVDNELERRHGLNPAWQAAGEQSAVMARLISARHIVGRVFVLQPDG